MPIVDSSNPNSPVSTKPGQLHSRWVRRSLDFLFVRGRFRMSASCGYYIHPISLFEAAILARPPGNDPRSFPWRCSTTLIWVGPPGSARNFAFRRDYPICAGLPVVSLSTETPLRQRARSCETPSGNRPRVGPPRSPASSSDAPRSKTVAGGPCSRTSEPIRLSSAV